MGDDRQVHYLTGGKVASHPDAQIAALAAEQHGVVARRQLLDVGLTPRMVDGRAKRGQLVPLHRGVYAVGHRHLGREGRWLAAVLAVPGAVLSHRDAAGLHGLRPANHARVDVTGIGARGRHAGIQVHRTTVLDGRDVVTVRRIPVTTVARTLVDLAGVVPEDHLRKALNEAERLRLLDVAKLRNAMARTSRRKGPGHTRLTEALAELQDHGPTLTRSSLEDAFLKVLRDHDLPLPATNSVIEGVEVDAVWRQRRLVVELDGYAYHRMRQAFERDRERDAQLLSAGYRTLRFTYSQVANRPSRVAGHVRAALAATMSA